MEPSITGLSATSNKSFTALNRKKALGLAMVINVTFVIMFAMNNSHSTEYDTTSTDFGKYDTRKTKNNIKVICEGLVTSEENQITSTKFSRTSLKLLPQSGNIIVNIKAFDKRNVSKSNGGDIIFVWAQQSDGDGRVPGKVIDHGNGSYTGMVPVLWTGQTTVYVRIASLAENSCLKYKALQKYGNIAYVLEHPTGLRAVFISKNWTELTPCNTNSFIYGSTQQCNFTILNGGMSWFCGRPTNAKLTCGDLVSFSAGSFKRSTKINEDKLHVLGNGMFNKPITFNVSFNSARNTAVSCNKRSSLESWTEPSPTGYFWNSHWEPINCHSVLKHTVESYRSCLRNKTLILLGDSTVRQYLNFFLKHILDINKTIHPISTFGPKLETYHGDITFRNWNITLMYRKQAMPLYASVSRMPTKNILSFPQIIDSVTRSNLSGSEIIMLINYHIHFVAYPLEQYRERVRHLVSSLKQLLILKPSARVFLKGPFPCSKDLSSWDLHIALFQRQILEEEFVDIKDKVTYLNVWEVGVAHNVKDVHPLGDALKSQIHQFMSFVC